MGTVVPEEGRMSELQQLRAYVAYVEDNLERMQRDGWQPVCFEEFIGSEECETYGGVA